MVSNVFSCILSRHLWLSMVVGMVKFNLFGSYMNVTDVMFGCHGVMFGCHGRYVFLITERHNFDDKAETISSATGCWL